jgi:hypothetical protein
MPRTQMGYDLDALLVLDVTRAYAAQIAAGAAALKLLAFVHAPPSPLRPAMRLRVGFVSSDIGQHPLSHLVSSRACWHHFCVLVSNCICACTDGLRVWPHGLHSH